MKVRSLFVTILSVVVAWAVLIPLAGADELTQQTKVTFDQPVEVPGTTLPAGSYWFVMATPDPSFGVVHIFSLDWKTLYATETTTPVEHRMPADGTIFTFSERPQSQPEALLTWFYPGETVGHEFMYPQDEKRELSRDQHQVEDMAQRGQSGD